MGPANTGKTVGPRRWAQAHPTVYTRADCMRTSSVTILPTSALKSAPPLYCTTLSVQFLLTATALAAPSVALPFTPTRSAGADAVSAASASSKSAVTVRCWPEHRIGTVVTLPLPLSAA